MICEDVCLVNYDFHCEFYLIAEIVRAANVPLTERMNQPPMDTEDIVIVLKTNSEISRQSTGRNPSTSPLQVSIESTTYPLARQNVI
jgi:hypothetical protein